MLSIKFARDAYIHDFTHTLACIRLTRPMRIFRSQFFFTRVARVGQRVQRVVFGRSFF